MSRSKGSWNPACLALLAATWYAASCDAGQGGSQDPLCRIAVMSNAYVTALPADEIREPSANGQGKSRSWLKSRSAAMQTAVAAAIRQLKPDAFVLLGSVTWTGSDADCTEAERFLKELNLPVYVTPGTRDVSAGQDNFQQRFSEYGGKPRYSVNLRGVHLQMAASPGTSSGDKADGELVAWMTEDLMHNRGARAVILFGGPRTIGQRPADSDGEAARRFWKLVDEHRAAIQILPGHDHLLSGDLLPRWTAPSMAWQEQWTLGLIEAYTERLEVHLIASLDQPRQTLTIPNPIVAPRLASADQDPHGNPLYTKDLSEGPLFSFVHATDPQIDDATVAAAAARYPHDEEMSKSAVAEINRLKPDFVAITGDLVNKNTPLEWETFNTIYSRLDAPLYLTPGNHDAINEEHDPRTLAPPRATEATGHEGPLALYRKFTQNYASGGRRFYSFRRNGCAFLGIDTHTQAIDPEQLEWINEELARNQGATHVFVMGHHPLPGTFGDEVAREQGGDELLALFKRHRVSAYLVGHRHRASRYLVVDGTAHVHCEDLAWGERGAYHVYHVFPDRIVCCWKPVYLKQEERLYERIEFPSPRTHCSN